MSTDPKSTYYDHGGIEVLDIIRAKLTSEQYQGYLLGNVLKYAARLNWKGASERDAEKLSLYAMWLHEELAPPPAERQEQVRERHDVVPDDPWTLESAITAAIDGDADARGWLAERGLHWDANHAGYPWYVSADSEVDEADLLTMQADGTYEQPDQRPRDRPLASHCADGGACKHKCGLEPCKEPSE